MGPRAQGAEPARRMYHRALTMVAEMPGYPIRKLPFAGPDTRTKAAISSKPCLSHHRHAEVGRVVGNMRVDGSFRTVHKGSVG